MTAKHTPGPWIAHKKTSPDCSEGTHYITCANGALGYWRGHKQGHTDSSWVLNKADARLIAAAPELLEALSELIAAGDNSMRPTDGDDVAAMIRFGEAEKAARAAIAKATGDAP